MAGKPKVTGLSFNIYAIVTLLVLLPLSTGFVTNIANRNSTDPDEDLIAENFGASPPTTIATDGMRISQWIDRGDNYTADYINLGSPYNQNPNSYSCLWTSTETDPTQCLDFSAVYGDLSQRNMRDGRNYVLMPETHRQVGNTGGKEYIGSSGDDFKISIEKNVFMNTDFSKDLSKIEFNMKKLGTFYSCDIAPTANITFDYKLYLYYGVNGAFHPTKTAGLPSFETQVQSYDGDQMGYDLYQNQVYCRGELNINVRFDALTAIELSEFFYNYGNDRSNVSGYIHFYNFKNTDNPNDLILDTELPFAGNGFFLLNIETNYIDTQESNFWLKGGAFIIGVGLFALSIASTPYWNPVVSFFKEGSN